MGHLPVTHEIERITEDRSKMVPQKDGTTRMEKFYKVWWKEDQLLEGEQLWDWVPHSKLVNTAEALDEYEHNKDRHPDTSKRQQRNADKKNARDTTEQLAKKFTKQALREHKLNTIQGGDHAIEKYENSEQVVGGNITRDDTAKVKAVQRDSKSTARSQLHNWTEQMGAKAAWKLCRQILLERHYDLPRGLQMSAGPVGVNIPATATQAKKKTRQQSNAKQMNRTTVK